ncbi:hypothetical protein H4R34_004449 [Dimargaris verticillata]|uniref:GTP-binding protein 8 n=1 Tax=Dimargaris verticillata TaxID=2761393 RepID=A0A9W8AY92_9FUNG|nr:hypothetical protein H4R34_004449 [Dimargaris verticillata]
MLRQLLQQFRPILWLPKPGHSTTLIRTSFLANAPSALTTRTLASVHGPLYQTRPKSGNSASVSLKPPAEQPRDPERDLTEKQRIRNKQRALLFAQKAFQKPANFLLSATSLNQVQHLHMPEVVFLGRSNVGKSTLIQTLLGRPKLVKTSKKPGHTSFMNFFCLGATIPSTSFLTLVDMPGYGYRSRSDWGQFIIEYLAKRKQLKMVYILIDANVGELKSTDLSMLDLLKAHRKPFRVVLTKTDKVQDISAVQDVVGSALEPYLPYFTPPFFPVSKVHKYEMAELRLDILVRCGVVVENW